IRPDLINAFAIGATESRLRVSYFLNAREAIDQLLNAADFNVAGSAESLAIARANVVSAGCRSRAENAVAESHERLLIVVLNRSEVLAIRWTIKQCRLF